MESITKLLAIGLLVSSLVACVTTVSGPQRKRDPEKELKVLIELGTGYIRNKEYARAKDNLTKALKLDPKSVAALNAFGLVYQVEGENDLAERYFKRGIASDPNFSPIRNNYGAFLFAQERYESAVKQLTAATEDRLYQSRPQVFQNLGVSYLKLSEPQKAEQAFLRSIQLNPKQARSLLELTELKLKQKDYVQARNYFRRLEATRQKNARSLWLCVQISEKFNQKDKAASCGLMLKNVYPNTYQYKRYQASRET